MPIALAFARRAALLVLVGSIGGACSSGAARTEPPDLAVQLAPPDLAISFTDDGGGGAQPCGPMNPCPGTLSCVGGTCVDVSPTCTSNDDCENDTYCACVSGGSDAGPCVGGSCVPYGQGGVTTDPDCQGASFPAVAFKPPVLGCSWIEDDTLTTPLVVDLDQNGKPNILFVTWHTNELIALHGKDCSVKWRVKVGLHEYNSLAAADLDGDHFPEVVGVDGGGHVVIFDRKGNTLDTSTDTAGVGGQAVPVIADIDNRAPPEIIVGGLVSRWVKGKGFTTLYNGAALGGYWGTASAVVDLDGDKIPEVITGTQVYSMKKMADITPMNYAAQLAMTGTGAFPAIADFNKDGKPDIALAQQGNGNEVFYIYDWAAQKFIYGPVSAPSSWNGAPAIADLDGDKVPDIATTGSSTFRVLSLKCWKNPMLKGCESQGILWSKKVRDTSGLSGPSAFDLNGDGKVDIVYRDECFLRVLDGPTGKTMFLAPVTSGTVLDYPVIADVDVDGHADVVVPSTSLDCTGEVDADTGTAWKGPATKGIFVYKDPLNRWMPSRSIWNEHTYHITNVADNATVPTVEAPNWKTWNNFRQNVQGNLSGQNPGIDFTAHKSTMIDNGMQTCDVQERLWASVCNRGTGIAPAGVPGTFYQGDPRMGGTPICTTVTTDPLNPGDCEDVYCDWANPPHTPQDLVFRIDDDGKMTGAVSECRTGNDLLLLPATTCSVPG